MRLVFLCNAGDKSFAEKLLLDQKKYNELKVIIEALPLPPHFHSALRKVVCTNRGSDTVFVNWCGGSRRSATQVSALDVSRALEDEYQVPFLGNTATSLSYDEETLRMLMFYSDLPTQSFAIIKEDKDVQLRAKTIKYPAIVRSGEGDILAESESISNLEFIAMKLLLEWPQLLVTSAFDTVTHVIRVFKNNKNAFSYKAVSGDPSLLKGIDNIAEKVTRGIIGGSKGHADVDLIVRHDEPATLAGLRFDCGIPFSENEGATLASAKLMPMAEDALRNHKESRPCHAVVYDSAAKGYSLRSARDIKKDEVVFRDEGRAFAIVTREHVARTWPMDEKITFSQYAWPLDSLGHVYAIWESDPRRWRPINHSCDPNLLFAAGHSLNVVAARDIPDSTELTMDYATFCDGTMKPFKCLCGATECRGLIVADENVMKKYQDHAWHRGVPAPVTDLAPGS